MWRREAFTLNYLHQIVFVSILYTSCTLVKAAWNITRNLATVYLEKFLTLKSRCGVCGVFSTTWSEMILFAETLNMTVQVSCSCTTLICLGLFPRATSAPSGWKRNWNGVVQTWYNLLFPRYKTLTFKQMKNENIFINIQNSNTTCVMVICNCH